MSKAKALISEVSKFSKILFVNPATNAVSERFCSTLRSLKTYL